MRKPAERPEGVIRLVTAVEAARSADNEEVVEVLERMLDRARSGQTVGLVAVEVRPSGDTASIMGPVPDFQRVLGGLRLLEHSLVERLTQ